MMPITQSIRNGILLRLPLSTSTTRSTLSFTTISKPLLIPTATTHPTPPPTIPTTFLKNTTTTTPKSFSSFTTTSSTRPFQILGIQQIAIGSLNKSSLSHLWGTIFGIPTIGQYTSEKENVDEDILSLGPTVVGEGEGDDDDGATSPFSVEIDLMTPLDPEKSPKVHSPALNHIGLWVDDLPLAVSWMTQNGVRFTPGGIRKGAAGHDVTFIHPKGNDDSPIGGCGVLIELVQAPPNVIKAFTTTTTTEETK